AVVTLPMHILRGDVAQSLAAKTCNLDSCKRLIVVGGLRLVDAAHFNPGPFPGTSGLGLAPHQDWLNLFGLEQDHGSSPLRPHVFSLGASLGSKYTCICVESGEVTVTDPSGQALAIPVKTVKSIGRLMIRLDLVSQVPP